MRFARLLVRRNARRGKNVRFKTARPKIASSGTGGATPDLAARVISCGGCTAQSNWRFGPTCSRSLLGSLCLLFRICRSRAPAPKVSACMRPRPWTISTAQNSTALKARRSASNACQTSAPIGHKQCDACSRNRRARFKTTPLCWSSDWPPVDRDRRPTRRSHRAMRCRTRRLSSRYWRSKSPAQRKCAACDAPRSV